MNGTPEYAYAQVILRLNIVFVILNVLLEIRKNST
nr:MAG TPA: hypothetical protein [Caudoviricetes sp.]